jgi:protein-S-isoprenylcysteine O-methyltransferase Ste14
MNPGHSPSERRNRFEVKSRIVESFLRSFAFSFLLFLYCAGFALIHARSFLKSFDFFELLHFLYNVTVALFFLLRTRPSMVSTHLLHWAVAVITSISGFFFVRKAVNPHAAMLLAGDTLIGIGVLFGLAAAIALGKSFDIFPALRRVKTQWVYRIIRHPIYLSAIVIRVGYVLKNSCLYNALLLILIVCLYDKRARYEEDLLSKDRSYAEYMEQVKYRFLPGIY